jgi:hypothetical protein
MEWTIEWPSEVGVYWFYGWDYGLTNAPAKFHLVEVHQALNGVVLVMDGAFMFKSEGHMGVFAPIQLPDPPFLDPTEEQR